MSDCPDILISLAPAFTKAILDGTKTVELRRRKVHAKVGTRIWLYSKVPTARVEGTARIERLQEGDLKGLWAEFSNEVGISKTEFEAYFRGCNKGYAIVLTGACAVTPAPDLKAMRQKLGGFHPPQFFKRLEPEEVKLLVRGCKMRSIDLQHSDDRQEKLP